MIDYKTFMVSPFAQNCRVFFNTDTKECAVFDPGDSAKEIYEAITNIGFSLKSILITHMHLDHVGGVGLLQQLSGAKVLGSSIADEVIKRSLDKQALMFSLPKALPFETEYLEDGQVIEPITNLKFKVLTTPGHTPGGVCYYSKEQKLVISGDTLFNQSIGRTDFEFGDYDAIIDSIKNKLFTLDKDTTVLCGHGPNTNIASEIENNPYVV